MLRSLSAVIALCLFSSCLQAELIVDNFSTGPFVGPHGTAIGAPAMTSTRTVTHSHSFGITSSFPGGGATTLTAQAGNSIILDYVFATPWTLNPVGQTPMALVIDLFDSVTGSFTLNVTVRNGGASSTAGSVLVNSAGPKVISSASFGANANNITGLTVRLNSLQTFSTTIGSGAYIVANPEPASLILITGTGLVGGWFARRRRKAAGVDMSV